MSSVAAPSICGACVRLDRTWEVRKGLMEPSKCSAYPDGIPGEINPGTFDHRQEFGGEEEGRRFLLREGEDTRQYLRLYEEMTGNTAGE